MQMRAPGVVQGWAQRVEEVGVVVMGWDATEVAAIGETSTVLVVRAVLGLLELASRLVPVATEEVGDGLETVDAADVASVEDVPMLVLMPVLLPATSA